MLGFLNWLWLYYARWEADGNWMFAALPNGRRSQTTGHTLKESVQRCMSVVAIYQGRLDIKKNEFNNMRSQRLSFRSFG